MSETLAQTTARITAFIQAAAPKLDLSPNTLFSELIINTEAQVQNYTHNEVSTLSLGQSISSALSSVTDTYNPIIDSIASNYNVTRNPGAYATGTIRIGVSSGATVTVPTGTTFIQPSLNFTYSTTSPITASVTNGLLLKGNLINTVASNYYYFDLPVQASALGTDKIVSGGTQFQLASTSAAIPNLLSANALGSFIQGQSMETDKQLITRFRAGQSAVNNASEDALYSTLKQNFAGFQSIYVADHNNILNLRASNNPFGLKLPGYIDVYLRNSVALPQTVFVLPGSSYNAGTGIWSISIPASSAPGFYRILSVVDQTIPGTPLPFSITYGVSSNPTNNVSTAEEARYSVYQTATLSVKYATTFTPNFQITALVPNQLSAVQKLLLNNNTRLPNADYLAKGVVPCEVAIYLAVTLSDSNPLNVQGLQSDIFNYVNGLGVGSPIVVSKIINICHKYNISQVNLPIVLKGTLRAPYNSVSGSVTDYDILLNGTDRLNIPNLPQYGVTPSNTAFFINYFGNSAQENISITINQ